ncbi:ABC transporter substrate-binding protein [Pelagicoccus enzymogenes]|uniref:MlaC/ttg2D family ABC transporter substrate-binding protein n=1 Tax=Pelagicoccus enzymogenes TaxID=2773457 RepID=UPI0028106595|nr:ABC transporter substrate-binding protein [Pelagicoccus enzymogenes]MDQ8199276.1 ABC transporter substrate-binding protein [Pelagicoccus enzymogenes]
MSPRILLNVFALFCFGIASLAQANVETDPQKQLEKTISSVIDILHDTEARGVEETRKQILSELEKSFSFEIIIRRTLARNWNQLSEAQRDRITVLITDLLIKAYTHELAGADKPKINFLKTDDLGSNKIEIFTTVSYKSTFVSVNYRLANVKSQGWQVYDILIEGTSIVSNYRGQFDEFLQTKTPEQLLELIESKIKEYDK